MALIFAKDMFLISLFNIHTPPVPNSQQCPDLLGTRLRWALNKQSIWQTAHVFPLLLLDCAKAGNVFYKINSYLIWELVCGFVLVFLLSCMEEIIKTLKYLLA